MKPRKPTNVEKGELLQYLINTIQKNMPEEEWREWAATIDRASIAVFDDYITDSPGYAGKVMVVVWSGSPTFTDFAEHIDIGLESVASW